MKTDDELNEQLGDMIEKHVIDLAQHFDNVLIIANSYDGEKRATRSWDRSRGNVFALEGHAKQWVDSEATPLGEDDDE